MLAIILALFVCNAAAHPTDGIASRIVGGRIANHEQFPHQVSLRDGNTARHICGGSIISENWILTSATCVNELNPSDIIAVVGTNYLTSGGTPYKVDLIRQHENYNPRENIHDIAVLHLSDSIALNSGVQIIPLAEYATQGGLNGIFSGWGLTSYPSTTLTDAIHYIILRTITINECKSYLNGFFSVSFSHVCTLVPSGQGLCTGDSGGPLIVHNKQHGISIWGIPCGKGYPDVFTSVSYYRSWIKDKTNV